MRATCSGCSVNRALEVGSIRSGLQMSLLCTVVVGGCGPVPAASTRLRKSCRVSFDPGCGAEAYVFRLIHVMLEADELAVVGRPTSGAFAGL